MHVQRGGLKDWSRWRVCIQINVHRPSLYIPKVSQSRCQNDAPFTEKSEPVVKYRNGSAVCLLGGEDKSEKDNQGLAWNPLEKAMGSFKGQSIEDVLRQQIDKGEFYDGGSGENPPRGGGGGGDGGSGESEDEGFVGIIDETMQVILATIGFIFLYVYIISGEELSRLGNDYLKFLFGKGKSVRLKRAMNKWKRFFQSWNEKKEEDPLWLEREIINSRTWFDSPEKYKEIFRSV
ncbi:NUCLEUSENVELOPE PROTEIN [Salix viminalis]|uniref:NUCLEUSENVELOPE PROTEIN n=1 Tax=Salix viminalis TaxID=40686 RepID=A0A9Q0V6C8_SALVM|nr:NUCLEUSENVELOPE PROTEIN [Salix viminalis]